ncbi:MAG: DUF2497 domain-containing protein [Oxalobacteraceae bacterium]|nr:MAG: DUF2497 domain-containing protein [Oxalobacteraceae bacterium]
MDDILASIRRILNEDEKTAKPPPAEVLMLDPSMIVEDGVHDEQHAAPTPASAPVSASASASANETNLHLGTEEKLAVATMEEPLREPAVGFDAPSPAAPASGDASRPDSPLVAPAAAAAAAHSVGSLVRTLAAERSALVTRGGLTIEDLVREEVRPVLKEWLDTHLPPLVERMVRAELERVVGRSV